MKRKLLVIAVAFVSLAAWAAAPAGASVALPPSAFCIDGQTYTFDLTDESALFAALDYASAAAEGGFYYDATEGTEEATEVPFGFDDDEFLPSDVGTDTTGLVFVSVLAGACGSAAAPPSNNVFVCYSKFQTDAGLVVTAAKAEALLASTSDHYFLPNAVLGTAPAGDPQLGAYYLQCNAPGTPTGNYLGDDPIGGMDIITAAEAATGLLGGSPGYYPIVK